MCVSGRINNMAKSANVDDNDARGMEFVSLDCRKKFEHNDISFVEISKIFAMQNAFFFETQSYERVYKSVLVLLHHNVCNQVDSHTC